ncbi:hypothetical protein NPIL_578171 [Nephila pilipes]|uniref:Uncharacterized protein n=1 Tax=Nephila pilipes TaxID=299642 RepID=A0A8X6P8F4_NEPPI|nr:hypothetical protein NPIL_578171 [Nephila pilipes]
MEGAFPNPKVGGGGIRKGRQEKQRNSQVPRFYWSHSVYKPLLVPPANYEKKASLRKAFFYLEGKEQRGIYLHPNTIVDSKRIFPTCAFLPLRKGRIKYRDKNIFFL